MEKLYYLVVNGKPGGPYNIKELKQMKFSADDFVKADGMDDYKQAHEIPALRELFGFQFSPTQPQYFGSFDQRLLAAVIDWFLVFGVFLITTLLGVIFFGREENRMQIALTILAFIPIANFFYHVWMEAAVKQGTFGKQLLRIKVCDLQGLRINRRKAFWRNLAKIISALPFFTGYLWSFFNKKQQCFHDIIAKTLVMKDRLL
ncbi:MAG: RDD family protein [Sphingobacteriaceae bacterium]